MRVFISHSSHDKPAVLALADALRLRGFDPWVDQWQIDPGDDIVARINQGLAEADAGLIVFSAAAQASHWVQAEWSALTFARIEQGRPLIPLTVGGFAALPPLLAPLLRRSIDEHDAIADALRQRGARPASAVQPEAGQAQRVLIRLQALASGGVQAEVHCADRCLGQQTLAGWPAGLAAALAVFQQGFGLGLQRELAAPAASSNDSRMATLGRQLAGLCLPGDSGSALQALIDGLALGQRLELAVEAADPALLGLPFEALRGPDGRLLATQPGVVMWRRPAGLAAPAQPPLAGPLKLLVAVGAPDEGLTRSAVLDQERELQSILDAVEPLNQQDNAQVRILEVGHPDQIAQAFARDAYHVLHLSCHGGPGVLELEDEDGRPVPIRPADLLAPLRRLGRPLPLVLLNACHGGVAAPTPGQMPAHAHAPASASASTPAPDAPAASFALALLQAGVPAVLAMQTAVSDGYATALARAFYGHLAQGEHLRPSRALALARQQLEAERQRALGSGAAPAPEYATATLYIAGEEAPLADFGADRRPLQVHPVHKVAGPVPQLQQDELIGRRPEQRSALRALRAGKQGPPGVLLTGIGGVGKSALAGRLMQRQAEAGALLAVCSGRYGLQASFQAVGAALRDAPGAVAQQLGQRFKQEPIDDAERQRLLHKALAEQPLLLVLDDFEQNLSPGGERFLDPDVGDALAAMAGHCQRGRLLLTCRHPLPSGVGGLQRLRLGPLSPAEQRKLVLRLPQLQGLAPAELQPVLRLVGGHPRLMEFVDALLHGGQGRLRHVTARLQALMQAQPAAPAAGPGGPASALSAAQLLAARDVFLDELLALARARGDEAALLQLAVCNLPISPDGLARMLADDQAQPGDRAAAHAALARLEDLSLLHRQADGAAQVHRWTAQGLAAADLAAHRKRCNRAGRYHGWRFENQSQDLGDAIEALRNYLAGDDFDQAVSIAQACFQALTRSRQAVGIAALAAEVLERLPASDPGFARVADQEASAHLALGQTQRAFSRYQALLQALQQRAQAEPDRADYQRDLAVSFERMGDLYRTLGKGQLARDAFAQSLAIRQRLALAEPDRADYQRNLAVSIERMGDLYRDLGQGEPAQGAFSQALAIRQRLALAEPDRADYQRDLAVSFNKMGDLYRDLGQGQLARDAFSQSLAIRQRLAQAEPDRADYQRALGVSFSKMGDLYLDLGQGEPAQGAFSQALAILQRLALAEPDRADYQRDLAVSIERMGDLYRALGQGQLARDAFSHALAIRQRLALAEPDRADYQRALAVSGNKMGDLYRDLGQGQLARDAFSQALAISQRLALAEPDRTDYQRDLAVSFQRMGDLCLDEHQPELAAREFQKSRDIWQRLSDAEPTRADLQRGLVIPLLRLSTLPRPDADTDLMQAWCLLSDLVASGRLNPSDQGLVNHVRSLMAQRGLPTG